MEPRPILHDGDGLFIRVSTESYLAADIQNNTLSGNQSNDLHIESFLAIQPAVGTEGWNAATVPRQCRSVRLPRPTP